MIVPTYAAMRGVFAAPAAVVSADGYLTFPGTAKLRTGGFTGLVTPTISAFATTITCNAGASDAVLGVHEYDWYLSQRTDVAASQCMTIAHGNPAKSGTVTITLIEAMVDRLLPGRTDEELLEDDSLAVIFRNVHLYVSRRSDRAYQWIRMVDP